jgi:hypothetical protein
MGSLPQVVPVEYSTIVLSTANHGVARLYELPDAVTLGGDLSRFVRMHILELFTAKEDEEIVKAWQDVC